MFGGFKQLHTRNMNKTVQFSQPVRLLLGQEAQKDSILLTNPTLCLKEPPLLLLACWPVSTRTANGRPRNLHWGDPRQDVEKLNVAELLSRAEDQTGFKRWCLVVAGGRLTYEVKKALDLVFRRWFRNPRYLFWGLFPSLGTLFQRFELEVRSNTRVETHSHSHIFERKYFCQSFFLIQATLTFCRSQVCGDFWGASQQGERPYRTTFIKESPRRYPGIAL